MNDADLQNALAEMSQLWGSQPNTPDGDRLDAIGVLINNYERLQESEDSHWGNLALEAEKDPQYVDGIEALKLMAKLPAD